MKTPKIVNRATVFDIFRYVKPIRLSKTNPYPIVLRLAVVGLLESLTMFALYPVVAIGLGENSKIINHWLGSLHSLGLNQDVIISAHLIFFVLFGLTCSWFRWGGESAIETFRAVLQAKSRENLANAVCNMQWSEFIKLGSGDSIYNLSTSSDKLAMGAQCFLLFLGNMTAALIMLSFMTALSPLFCAIFFVSICLVYQIYKRRSFKASINANVYSDKISEIGIGYSFLMQNLKYCRISGFSVPMMQKIEKASQLSTTAMTATYKSFASQRTMIDAAAFSSIALVVFMVIMYRPSGFSEASVFLAVFYRVVPKIVYANIVYQKAMEHLSFADMWMETLNYAITRQDEKISGLSTPFENEICVTNVSFSPSPEGPIILKNLNLLIKRNSFTAILGVSGSGKSTFFDLISGLIKPSEGSILIDNVDLKQINAAYWKKQIGFVLQDNAMIRGSIIENIAFMDDNPDVQWAMECAKMANTWDFINRLPQKFNTVIHEKLSLSGGEAQRIALARALYYRPKILILDEPTSALDANAEHAFLLCLENLKGRVTILMATHRYNTMLVAPDVIIFNKGEVIEGGKALDLANNERSALRKIFAISNKVS